MYAVAQIVQNAYREGVAIPAFNVPYLPMVAAVVQAVVDCEAFAMIETARLEWYKFAAKGPQEVLQEFQKWQQPEYVSLHLDHVPVIDEDGQQVDFLPIFEQAIDLGYQSIMVDGSRLSMEDNIAATRLVVEMAHRAGIPCEAELGAVLGHEIGPLPPYEDLFASGKGFTQVEQADRFVRESGCDWLSVAIGNVHGAISGALKDRKKVAARLDLEHLEMLRQAAGIPLVLHGGSGVIQEYVLEAFKRGIAKINIATEIRQPYEAVYGKTQDVSAAQTAVYERTCWLLRDYYRLAGIQKLVVGLVVNSS